MSWDCHLQIPVAFTPVLYLYELTAATVLYLYQPTAATVLYLYEPTAATVLYLYQPTAATEHDPRLQNTLLNVIALRIRRPFQAAYKCGPKP
jgi:hypothetical protein